MFTRRKLLGKQLAGAKAFAANPDPAAAGSALCAHLSRGVKNAGLASAIDGRNLSGGQLPFLTQDPRLGSYGASFKGRTLTADNSLRIELAN
jgi:hypothetical protein